MLEMLPNLKPKTTSPERKYRAVQAELLRSERLRLVSSGRVLSGLRHRLEELQTEKIIVLGAGAVAEWSKAQD